MVLATLPGKKSQIIDDLKSITDNDSINPRHYDEWRESAVNEEIIRLNVSTIYDPRKIDEILGRNTSRRWKHSTELVPAWVVAGVDPLTDENTFAGVQVKPDITPLGKDGKPNKYLNASGMEVSPLFLKTGIEGYWESVIKDVIKPVIITEGAKKAGAGLSAGYATISVPGVSTCRKNGRLHHLLEVFASLGRTFYLCFDNDILYKKPVQDGLTGLAAQLAKNGSNVMVVKLPSGDAKGMDDYISMHGVEDFQELIKNAVTFKEWKDEITELQADEDDKPKSKIARNYEMINEAWGDSLRYNSLKKEIEFNGMPLNAEYLKLLVGLEFPVDISKDDAFTIVEFIAKRNSYSPVIEYLDEVEAKFPDVDTTFLNGLAKQFFGTDDPLHAKYFKNFLVASVARARNPGCWMDCALLLVGKQGIRKSTFWRTLYGDDFFSDDLGDGTDKDERMKMHRFWCLEWSEFETVYKRKDIAQLKAFLARRHETFRTPYDRLPKDYKRGCVFAGTTNETEILNDPSGNRRFWIIACLLDLIPIEEVQKHRDRIWAAANALYKSGYSYKLDLVEETAREVQNQEYEVTHPWTDIISKFISQRDYVTIQEIYHELAIDPVHQNPANQRQITVILKKLNCEPERIKVMGKWVRIWREKPVDLKIENSAVTAGSNYNPVATIQPQQASEVDPGENAPLDQVVIDIPLKTDPLEEKIEITVSQADSNTSSQFDPPVPAVPAENTIIPAEYILPSVNAELLRECIADGNWEMIQELTESWDIGYKMEVWDCLTDSEKKAIRELKQPSPSPTPLGYDPNKIPLIKEKATYWSKSKNCKITVFIISAVGDEVQAKIEGKKGIYNFSFHDLACCEESPVSDIAAGDRVKILSNGKRAKASSVVYQTIYLKDEKNKSVRGEFYAHQLEKL